MKRHESKSTPTDPAVGFALAEYSYEQRRVEASISTINQSLTLYVAALGLMVTCAVGTTVGLWTHDKRAVWLVLSTLGFAATAATTLALVRMYRTRMQQSDAERALARLRNYLVNRFPDIRPHVTGPINDDWQTPYTHQFRSGSYYGWATLCTVAGVLTGFSVLAVAAFLEIALSPHRRWTIGAIVGGSYCSVCLVWLQWRLQMRRRAQSIRFPSTGKLTHSSMTAVPNDGLKPSARTTIDAPR